MDKTTIILVCIIFSLCSCLDSKEETATGSNYVYYQEKDEFTGWTRVHFKNEDKWGFIDEDSIIKIPFEYQFLNSFDKAGFVIARRNGKEGFINTKNEVVIPLIYENVDLFYSELAAVKLNGKYGFIDRKGAIKIPFLFDKTRNFRSCNLVKVCNYGRCGVINKKGKIVIPLNFSDIEVFNEDKMILLERNAKWAFLTLEGEQLTDFIYDKIHKSTSQNNNSTFSKNGLILVENDGAFSFLDQSLNTVIPFGEFDIAFPMNSHGLAIVSKNDRYGLLDKFGKLKVPLEYSYIKYTQEYPNLTDCFIVSQKSKYGLMSQEGELLVKCEYDVMELNKKRISSTSFESIFCAQHRNQKYGVLDNEGKELIPFIYDDFIPLDGDKSIAVLEGKYGLVDFKNNIILPFRFDEMEKIWSGYHLIARLNNQDGVFNLKGEKLIPIFYDEISPCYYDNDNRFIVKKQNKVGVISKKKTIIPLEYDSISNWVEYGPDEHFVYKNNRVGLISRTGEIQIPIDYDSLFFYNEGYILVEKNGKEGIINIFNETVLDLKYDSVYLDWSAIFYEGKRPETFYVKNNNEYFLVNLKGEILEDGISKETIDKL